MSDAILDVQGLVGGYGKMTILNGTSFSVPAGSITTVIGPNGAGKSTVFKAIFGLLKLREGRIMFKGRDVTGLSQRESARPRASATCRRGATSSRSCRCADNIELGARRRRRATSPTCRRGSRPALDQFPGAAPEGDAAGLHAVGRRAEAARNRPRPAAQSATDADRRAVDRAFAAAGAGRPSAF